MTVPVKIDFRQILFDDTYVVWLSGANRFLKLKEPAFFVFERWAEGVDTGFIARLCSERYGLPEPEAIRFVGEITGKTEKLMLKVPGSRFQVSGSPQSRPVAQSLSRPVAVSRKVAKSQNLLCGSPRLLSGSLRLDFTCKILGKTIRFTYSEPELEKLFRPMFRQFEVECMTDCELDKELRESLAVRFNGRISLFLDNCNYAFSVNDQEPQIFGTSDTEHFQGAVLMELLNILHDKSLDDWMGVFHASAVSSEDTALLFIGDPGAGKTTLAMLMVANGWKMISDDFVPVDKDNRKVYPLPSAVSIKKGSVPALEKFFPELDGLQVDEEREVLLQLPDIFQERSPLKVKALVFVRYDASADFRMVKESNLEMMSAMLTQSWFPGNAEAAQSFMEWYFAMPVYSLVYPDSEKVVRELKNRLE